MSNIFIVKTNTVIPIPEANLYLCFGNKTLDMRRAMSDIFGEPKEHLNCHSYSCWQGNNYGLFYQNKGLSHGRIAHEIFHTTNRIWEHRNHLLTPNVQEPHAYLCEWITNWVYSELKEVL